MSNHQQENAFQLRSQDLVADYQALYMRLWRAHTRGLGVMLTARWGWIQRLVITCECLCDDQCSFLAAVGECVVSGGHVVVCATVELEHRSSV